MKYESPITYHSKDMANVKVFADRQINRRRGQKLYAPDLSILGHKKHTEFLKSISILISVRMYIHLLKISSKFDFLHKLNTWMSIVSRVQKHN
jgi:hypothetical protein